MIAQNDWAGNLKLEYKKESAKKDASQKTESIFCLLLYTPSSLTRFMPAISCVLSTSASRMR